jgi:hypothetical protein
MMLAEPRIETRVFVVGVPRSGTTLVQSLLAAHSTTASFTESHFFDRHFTRLVWPGRAILTRNPLPRLHDFLNENGEAAPAAARWFDARGRWLLRLRPLLPLQTLAVARRLLRVLDELTLRRGKSSWIEKTPRHLRYIPFLERVSSPESRTRFVHVIRDGVEVVASLHEASQRWERPYDLEACVRRWNAEVGFSLSRIAAPTDHFVFYEELTARPEATLRPLLADLGLGWQPDILERYARTSHGLVTEQEAWKADVGRSIRRSESSQRTLSERQRDRATQLLRLRLYDEVRERTGKRSHQPGGGRG